MFVASLSLLSSPSAFFFFLFCFSIKASSASITTTVDYIAANNSLVGFQTIISSQGKFVLGFFMPGNNTSASKYYLGIWYNNISPTTTVWVANRASPIADPSSSKLSIATDGNLVLVDHSGTLIWSTNLTQIPSNSTIAVLNDFGNLALVPTSNSSNILWQSIDHPSNTWLPGGKLALDKATGVSQRLISWKNTEDPTPGIFSLEIDPLGSSQYFILWNDSFNYWTSGLWEPQLGSFSNVPEMAANSVYKFAYVSNDEENYFTYSVLDDSIITRFVMDLSGQIKQMTWINTSSEWILFWSEPKTQCEVHAFCGPFSVCNEVQLPYCNCLKGFSQTSPLDWALGDQSGGCVRNTLLQCETIAGASSSSSSNSDPDKFYEMPNVKLPLNAQTSPAASTGDCGQACLSNCSCTAYSYGSNCLVWYGDLINLQVQYSGTDQATLYLRLAASELPSSKSNKGMISGIVAGVAAAILVVLALVLFLFWRRRRTQLLAVGSSEGPLMAFRYVYLLRVTKNFSEKIGGGAFGSVFKGVLPNSTIIAVKKLEGLRQGEKQFRAEVSTIGTIQHVNLVRLLGFCCEGNNRLLVYDFMANGSLDTHLFQNSAKPLDWKTRYSICLGVARGLTYLHEKCRDCIIHCDIKPENVLLDANFAPKVADFGLAKIVGHDFSRVLTTLRGTRGYLAPEWISGVAITPKADVYSYGMMLFEIISGKRNSDHSDGQVAGFFPMTASAKLIEGDDILDSLDTRMEMDADTEEVKRVLKVAGWCIQDEENLRPSMGQIVQIFEGLIDVKLPPLPRAIQVVSENAENIVFFSEFVSGQEQSTIFASSQTKTESTVSSKE